MPQQPISSVENNFTQGLKTEYTGLNFPENAATDTDNCIYTLVGNVTRRLGIDWELNYGNTGIDRTGKAISTYVWNNAGGDGTTRLYVMQTGGLINFYQMDTATVTNPVSTKNLTDTVTISDFTVDGNTFDQGVQCQYADGNGYLIIFHPDCMPMYVSYNPSDASIVGNPITIMIRDLIGTDEGTQPINLRPAVITGVHLYNLQNQGWTGAAPWTGYSAESITPPVPWTSGHTVTWTDIASGLPITIGDTVVAYGRYLPDNTGIHVWNQYSGVVTAYSGNTLTINTYAFSDWSGNTSAQAPNTWTITPTNSGFVSTWSDAFLNYPSNADVWFRYKNSSGIFDPVTTYSSVAPSSGPAPKGHYILDAFNLNRTGISAIDGLYNVTTFSRPDNGTWFAGRVWYTGVNGFFGQTENTSAYSWTENIYFTQIIQTENDFGKCYQQNDPTDENLFDLLPTDGGVITIQGCGHIYKLFPIQNGLLVFAQLGIWFITGSQGIGFSANDYTITKISSVQTTSSNSFVNVQGLPYFWNDEGIYTIVPSQQGLGLQVEPLTLSTILSYYEDIPKISKLYARGDYNPIDYTIQWVFRSEEETSVTDRYEFDKILVYNTSNKAFYPYSIAGTPKIHSVNYFPDTGALGSAEPMFKYLTSRASPSFHVFTLADEHNTNYKDWIVYDGHGVDFSSYFVTGYKLHGQGQRRFQLGYVYVYSNADVPTAYNIQGIWDYANDPNSGKWTNIQQITNALTRFGRRFRRHKIRGRGLVLQFKVSSVSGMPFDINGWSVMEQQNTGV